MLTLNIDQQKAERVVQEGGNLFLSGAGGYGKSFLIEYLKTDKSIVCAPTGAAALVVNGSTNHRVFQAPLGVIREQDAYKIKPATRKVLQGVDRVFLDEISIVRTDMMGHIDRALQVANENKLPFGGKQVVAVGDFYQLSAFTGYNEKRMYQSVYGNKLSAFESDSWNFNTVELTQPMRNTNLGQLEVLQDIRVGLNVRKAVDKLLTFTQPYSDSLDVTHLCSFNKDADYRNASMYRKLTTKEVEFKGVVKGALTHIKKECRVPVSLKVKEGMRVMTVVNDEDGDYVNGSTGVIESISEMGVQVRLDTGVSVSVEAFEFEVAKYQAVKGKMKRVTVASLRQLPIVPAWAISIHKSQGATLEQAVINLGAYTFADALFYVGVSRVKDLSNISFVRTPTASDVKVNPKVLDFYNSLRG